MVCPPIASPLARVPRVCMLPKRPRLPAGPPTRHADLACSAALLLSLSLDAIVLSRSQLLQYHRLVSSARHSTTRATMRVPLCYPALAAAAAPGTVHALTACPR